MNALVVFVALALRRPGVDASDEEIAAWYLAKAQLHEQLAERGGGDAALEMAYAAAAHEHALRLLRRATAKRPAPVVRLNPPGAAITTRTEVAA